MIETARKDLTQSQLRYLEQFGEGVVRLGLNFAVCDCDGNLVLTADGGGFDSDTQLLTDCARRTFGDVGSDDGGTGASVQTFDGEHTIITATLCPTPTHRSRPEILAVALVDLGSADEHSPREAGYIAEMLTLLANDFQKVAINEKQMEKIGGELAQKYEELVLLHNLGMNMKITEVDNNFLQMACDSLTEIVQVEGIAILMPRMVDDDEILTVTAGSGIIEIDERMANIIYSRIIDELNTGAEALLDSDVDTPMRYEWDDNVRSIILVPLFGKENSESNYAEVTVNDDCVVGVMVAINRLDKEDFDSIDIQLFNSVANGCAVFIDNGRLFGDLKELFLGSLMALTSSIDAKDQYTRGHSERVAFISRWIAERVAEKQPLDDDQINKVYLAGLLHDIGKIGVDESVLRKTGKLTEEERDTIKAHPAIGAGILRTIRQMKDVVPGVLCHHERMDGYGYPQGLTGDQIPLIGKIVQLADTFDAMTSRRTYRDALSIEKAISEIEKGLGTQFDAEIGQIFLDSDIRGLWEIISDGFGEIHGMSHITEYGTAAVGTLLR